MTPLLPRELFISNPHNNTSIKDIIVTSKEVWSITQRVLAHLS